MPELNKRLHILLAEDQLAYMKEVSRKTGRPLSELVREAIDRLYRPHSSVEGLLTLQKLKEQSFLGELDLSDLRRWAVS